MRLIACQDCHSQYDVSDVDVESFVCRCGTRIENQKLTPVDARIHRCGSCGALVSADAASCEYCLSEIVRDESRLSLLCPECCARNADDSRFCTACGVAFDPAPIPSEGVELPCPCCSGLMPPRAVGGFGINECPTCNGIWVPGEHFERLVARAIEQHEAGDASPEPRVKGANPALQKVEYRKCPVCEAFMQRRNFQKTSGVIIDVCRAHGTWLDADELERIAGFLTSGGRPDASAALAAEAARAESEYRNARRSNGASQAGVGIPPLTTRSANSAGASILRMLFELL